jgi:hypothetical protein
MNYYYKLSLTFLCCSLAIDTGARQVCVLVIRVLHIFGQERLLISQFLFFISIIMFTQAARISK